VAGAGPPWPPPGGPKRAPETPEIAKYAPKNKIEKKTSRRQKKHQKCKKRKKTQVANPTAIYVGFGALRLQKRKQMRKCIFFVQKTVLCIDTSHFTASHQIQATGVTNFIPKSTQTCTEAQNPPNQR
jgi:hypothetical protein